MMPVIIITVINICFNVSLGASIHKYFFSAHTHFVFVNCGDIP